jgi:hypothetical protein
MHPGHRRLRRADRRLQRADRRSGEGVTFTPGRALTRAARRIRLSRERIRSSA